MAAHSFFRYTAVAFLLLGAAACKYPYEMELPTRAEYPFVIEGDILIGANTTLYFRYAQPLEGTPQLPQEYMDTTSFRASGYIEGEDGSRVDGYLPEYSFTLPDGQVFTWKSSLADHLVFDTDHLRTDQRYRLHLETKSSQDYRYHTFETEWMEVRQAPVVDRLSYTKNEASNELWIGLSMHCNGSSHFRWSYLEEWEYHSDLRAQYYYDPNAKRVERGDGGVYRCWQRHSSSKIDIISTENQVEDRFEDLAIIRIPLDDRRLQVLYRVTVSLEALSEDGYNFWRTVRENTDEQGSIFAPTPSQISSNLRCISDPDYRVLGYVGLTGVTEAVLYYDNEEANFFQRPKGGYFFPPDEEKHENTDIINAARYKQGQRIWHGEWENTSPTPSHFVWVNAECIDCRLSGGTLYKPADWPEKEGIYE